MHSGQTVDERFRMSNLRAHNPPQLFPPYRGYAHAVEVPADARTLYISGLNGFDADGVTMPPDFVGQAELVWRHLGVVLGAARMSYDDLVMLRFFLTRAEDDPANVDLIAAHLGDHLSCRTVVVQQLLEPRWLIEVEAIAATSG
ncbi:RidA family protein [Microbacterium sp.]|uniref:RidA family protein n=1 Tax=Microbacterium sp. TaxID=51671 RepID=UPI002810A7E4|nr:RidA family protein [Microbacterium sp.]